MGTKFCQLLLNAYRVELPTSLLLLVFFLGVGREGKASEERHLLIITRQNPTKTSNEDFFYISLIFNNIN